MSVKRVLTLFIAGLAILAFDASSAAANTRAVWAARSVSLPTVFSTENTLNEYRETVTNVGSKPAEGTITIHDRLPSGLEASMAEPDYIRITEPGSSQFAQRMCTVERTLVTCEYSGEALPPGTVVELQTPVLATRFGSFTNNVEVEEGGVLTAVTSPPSTVANSVLVGGPVVPSFGVQSFAFEALTDGGEADVQAGDHPASVTTALGYNTLYN